MGELCYCLLKTMLCEEGLLTSRRLIGHCPLSPVYNYWEPLHFLLHGDGFRTWEYSSKYAIRSWAYLLLHTLPARLVTHLNPSDKVCSFAARLP